MANYWTVKIGRETTRPHTKWHPTEESGPFSVLTRGAFGTRDEACQWASREIGPGNWTAVEIPEFTAEHVGCYADGASGHTHVRAVLGGLLKGTVSVGPVGIALRVKARLIIEALRADMSDDASEEDKALDFLNTHSCADGVQFELCDGDLILCAVED